MIYSPKKREIVSTAFRDRVYQRSMNDNEIYPRVTNSFIRQNCACQFGKGTDFARDTLKKYLHRIYFEQKTNKVYFLKIDIHGYYPNMRHDLAKNLFSQKLPTNVYIRASKILDEQYGNKGIGFKPGSQMIQIAGIGCLDKVDHFIKEKLRIKFYIRYMDDFILLHHDKEYLLYCQREIQKELLKIGFEFNPKKTGVKPMNNGIMFLGFRFLLTDTGKVVMLINTDNVKRYRKKLAHLVRKAKRGEITKAKVDECYSAWKAHVSKGNCYHLIQRMDKYYAQLWRNDL